MTDGIKAANQMTLKWGEYPKLLGGVGIITGSLMWKEEVGEEVNEMQCEKGCYCWL